jgi:hypothetical protein
MNLTLIDFAPVIFFITSSECDKISSNFCLSDKFIDNNKKMNRNSYI